MTRLTSTRREFLSGLAGGLATAATLGGRPRATAAETPGRKIKVAAVVTEFTYRSHAHCILESFLEPYLFNGKKVDPTAEFEVVGLFMDQVPDNDMGRQVAREYGFPVYKTIAEALTLGKGTLQADAVLSIGEFGKYPVNSLGQMEYPRKRFFDEVVAVMEKSGRPVPLFNDKHLSYRWDWAEEMVDTAARLKIPFMAGSSVPLAARRPPMEVPAGSEILEAVSIHGGGVESYDFHGLEVLQSVVESRRGGETGVAEVRFLEGDEFWAAARSGLWSEPLADAAVAANPEYKAPTLRAMADRAKSGRRKPHGILATYRDGLRALTIGGIGTATTWSFSARLAGEDRPRATSFYVGPWENRNLFKALSHAIQSHFRGESPYPIQRTLLTTGILETAMRSRRDGGKPLATPQLAIAYTPTDFRAFREMGESWKILTPGTPQPRGIDTSGRSAS
jgi:hypothetical protein